MNKNMLQQAAKMNKEHRRKSIWRRIVSVMAAIVVFCTTYALILPALTLERDKAEENGVIVENVGTEAEEVNTIEDGETSPSAEPAQNGEPTEATETEISTETETTAETETKDITFGSVAVEAAYLPAQTFEAETKDVKVYVEAEAGAFPAGTTMEVKPVTDDEVKTAVEQAIRGEVKQLKAVDITFKNAEGTEIEPLAEIRVKMTSDVIKEIDAPVIVHIDDKGNGEIVKQTEEDKLEEKPAKNEVVFDSDAFSVYAIVGAEETDHVVRVTYKFEDSNGNPFYFKNTSGDTVDNQIIKNGEILENVGAPDVDVSSQTFRGWAIYNTNTESFSEFISFDTPILISTGAETTTVTATRIQIADEDNTSVNNSSNPDYTVTVRPYYGNVHYVTFYNQVDGYIVFNRVQVIDGSTYDISQQEAVPPDAMPVYDEDGETIIGYESVSYAFTGWSEEPGVLESVNNIDEREEITETLITVNDDIELYPIFRLSHWVNFYTAPTGSGATYYAPVYILNGHSVSEAQPQTVPYWEGHTFVGWFTEPDDDYLSVGETTNGEFDFTGTLSGDITLYAHWNAGTANVTIIQWLQLVTDSKDYNDAQKNYEYGGQVNVIRDVNTLVYSTEFDDMTGFMVNYAKSDESTVVLPDGTSALNVYYDRKLITMVFNGIGDSSGTYYNSTTGNTGTQYGIVNGQYVELSREPVTVYTYSTANNYSANTGTTGTRYALIDGEYVALTREEVYTYSFSNTYTVNTTGTNNLYGIYNGQYVQLYYNNGTWYRTRTGGGGGCGGGGYNYSNPYTGTRYQQSGSSVYTGTRYARSGNNGNYSYTPTTSDTGTQYGLDDNGVYQQLTRSTTYVYTLNGEVYGGTRYAQGNGQIYQGTRFVREGDSAPYTYTATTENTGTQYAVDGNGGHVLLNRTSSTEYQWTYTDSNGVSHVYNGNRYVLTNTSGNAEIFTGLYGQTLEFNEYSWPDDYVWWYRINSGTGRQGMTYLGQFILPNNVADSSGQVILFNQEGDVTDTVYFYLQNVDESYPDDYNDTGTGSGYLTFTFSEKYDGFRVASYQRWYLNNNIRVNVDRTWQTAAVDQQVQLYGNNRYYNMDVRYERISYEFKYLDSRNGTELADLESVQLKYEEDMANANPNVSTLTPPTSQYEWDGHWYIDQDCTTIALFSDDLTTEGELGNYTSIDTTSKTVTYGTGSSAKTYSYQILGQMPNHDYAVYAGWVQRWYWIKVDPNGGELSDTESTWFWLTYGDKIQEYHDVTRIYVEDENGLYYYHYDELNPETELNQYGTNERRAYYSLDGNVSSNGGQKYSQDATVYSLVGWYQVDTETGELMGVYNFDGGIVDNTWIRAIWRKVGDYTVAYSNLGVDSNGNAVEYPEDDELEREGRISSSPDGVPVDYSHYADKSNTAFANPITDPPEGYSFIGWYYNGNVYNPGDVFTVMSELADENDTVWLYPVFVSYEDLPVRTTHIYWYSNFVDTNGDQIGTLTSSTQASNETRNADIQINKEIDIIDIDQFLTSLNDGETDYRSFYDGYRFVGWAKVQDADTGEATEPWLIYDAASRTYSMVTEDGIETGITQIAADENMPYDNMVAVWEKKTYTVEIDKVVVGLPSDNNKQFVFDPDFSEQVNISVVVDGETINQNTNSNFVLTGTETVVSTEGSLDASSETITYYPSKVFYQIPYGTTVAFNETNAEGYSVESSATITMQHTDGTTTTVSTDTFGNNHAFEVTGDMVITYKNTRATQDLNVLKVSVTNIAQTLSGAVFSVNSTTSGWVQSYFISNDDGYLVPAVASTVDGVTTYTPREGATAKLVLPVGTYTLTEIKAPDGYNLLADDVTLTVKPDDVEITQGGNTHFSKETSPTIVTYADGTFAVRVTNTAGQELPMTGGRGTLTYTLGGLLLMGGALVYGFGLRRRRERRFNE
jgi:LPXTG-motif cell wall-anchored protein/uncharacterized repeat protein (TIGR02543 family)